MQINHMTTASKATPQLLQSYAALPTKFAYGGCSYDERTNSVHFSGGYKGLGTYNRSYFWYNIATDTYGTSAAVLPNNYVQTGSVVRREVNTFIMEGGIGGAAIGTSYTFPLKGSTVSSYTSGDARYQKAMAQSPTNERIYMVGGSNGSSLVATARYYRASLPGFTDMPNMPSPLNGHYAVIYNEDLYVIGGWTGTQNNPYIYKYTATTNSWSTEATLPIASAWNGAVVYKDSLVVGTGFTGKQYFMVYNLITKVWRLIPTAISRRFGCGLVADTNIRNGIFIFGGVINGTVDNMPAADCYSTNFFMPEVMFL